MAAVAVPSLCGTAAVRKGGRRPQLNGQVTWEDLTQGRFNPNCEVYIMMTRFDPTIFDEMRSYALKGTVLMPMLREGSPASSNLLTRAFARVGGFAARWGEHLTRPRQRMTGGTGH